MKGHQYQKILEPFLKFGSYSGPIFRSKISFASFVRTRIGIGTLNLETVWIRFKQSSRFPFHVFQMDKIDIVSV